MGTTTFVVFSDAPALPWEITAEYSPETRRISLSEYSELIDFTIFYDTLGNTFVPLNISATFWI